MLAAYGANLGTQQEVARMFGVGRQCLSELLRQRRTRGTITPRHGGGHPPAGYRPLSVPEFLKRKRNPTLMRGGVCLRWTGPIFQLRSIHCALL